MPLLALLSFHAEALAVAEPACLLTLHGEWLSGGHGLCVLLVWGVCAPGRSAGLANVHVACQLAVCKAGDALLLDRRWSSRRDCLLLLGLRACCRCQAEALCARSSWSSAGGESAWGLQTLYGINSMPRSDTRVQVCAAPGGEILACPPLR